jgi:hypothetical protein
MQQRRLRLGDIVDDYCPRERRITNHAIVAMIEEQVKQTRCTTCDADHEYKQARIPAQRRKKDAPPALVGDAPGGSPRKRGSEVPSSVEETEPMDVGDLEAAPPEPAGEIAALPDQPAPVEAPESEDPHPSEDEGPVHRRLIRATLPRVEGQTPERKAPEFTIHQREANGNRAGAGRGPRRAPRPGQARPPHSGGGQPQRFGGQHHGQGQPTRQGSGQTPRHGSGSSRHGSGQGGQHGPQGNRPTGHSPAGQQRHNRGGRKRSR